MLFGIIWAALAPLTSVHAIGLLAWALRRSRVRWSMPIAVVVILAPVGGIWLWQRAEFVTVCDGEGKPTIFRRASADGVFLNSQTANSFGMRYLQDDGFSWVEAPSIYKRGAWVRYQRSEGDPKTATILTKDVEVLTARYEVREDFSEPFSHTSLSQTKVIDRESNEVIAKAGSATFSGGAMKWALGAWGMLSCPSAFASPETFNAYYHLARDTLRSQK